MLSKLRGPFRIFSQSARRAVLIAGLLALPAGVAAQSSVVLGRASVQLTGPWKFHTGDNPAWAQPDFDDSA